ncbi:hypothetical protein [Devosia sp. 1566]|uniref:hypothetical protein n=1 Tax=Devosia sp. 1566 TaxID=2499144 RepID=UPI000FD7EC6A|nr:hypothetical protein [Devosia sp. 1566]
MKPILVPTLAELAIEMEKAVAAFRTAEAAWDAYPHPGPSRDDPINVRLDAETGNCLDVAAQIGELPA